MKYPQIGKGLFSKVYRKDENTVLINSVCHMKECLAEFIDSEWFPKLETEDFQLYICKYYNVSKSVKGNLNAEHYALYQELRKISLSMRPDNMHALYSFWYEKFQTVSNESLKEALLDFLDNASNYGSDVNFEISPRNVACDNGKLVLLDCFFLQSQCIEVRKKGSKLYAY